MNARKWSQRILGVALLAVMIQMGPISAGGSTPRRVPDGGRPTSRGPASLYAPAAVGSADVGSALDVPSGFVSASMGASSGSASTILSTPLRGFPTAGSSYVVLSTGDAASAVLANDSSNFGSDLGGPDDAGRYDIAQLRIELTPPATAKGFQFDAMFLSDEFPEFVGSSFNDVFTAEQGQTQLSIQNGAVFSPFNFAYDTSGNIVDVNTVVGVIENPWTDPDKGIVGVPPVYDGATPVMRVSSPIEKDLATGNIVLYLTIQDLGDGIYDSAVFLDNFQWLTTAPNPGVVDKDDTDGDSLPNAWETNGYDFNNDGVIDVDLPAMGADPNKKDIFVEIDWMDAAGHNHKPKPTALANMVKAFANAPVSNPDGSTGITLHMDAGADSVMNPKTGALWGARSRSGSLAEIADLGTSAGGNYSWTAFDAIKATNFQLGRADVFHYCVFAHKYGGGASSGISRGIPGSDLIIADGCATGRQLTVQEQAGTLMHEFGHNLNLGHGGGDHTNYKPNYLSIMNYSFQFTGLLKGGAFGTLDYSRDKLSDLNEASLNENAGLDPDAIVGTFGTVWGNAGHSVVATTASGAIDWNRDGAFAAAVASDLNFDGSTTNLVGYDDWAHVRFDGGAVGAMGDTAPLEVSTLADEPSYSDFVTKGLIITEHPEVTGALKTTVAAGTSTKYVTFRVQNMGTAKATYKLSAKGYAGSKPKPARTSITLSSGKFADVKVAYLPPAASKRGTVGSVYLTAATASNALILDEAQTIIVAKAAPKVTLTRPNAPKSLAKGKSKAVTGYLKPRHPKGSKVVQIQLFQRNSKGKYVYKGHVHTKLANFKSYSKYTGSIKFRSKGKWRVRAYMPADAIHAATYSGFGSVTVK